MSADELETSNSTMRRPSAVVSPRIAAKPKPVIVATSKKRSSRDSTPTADIIKVKRTKLSLARDFWYSYLFVLLLLSTHYHDPC